MAYAGFKLPGKAYSHAGRPQSGWKLFQTKELLQAGSYGKYSYATGVDMKQTLSMKPMDFEKWAELAISDPAEFEEMRRAAIDEFLASVSAERRLQLQRLQWRVDRLRERSPTPMAATIAISEMMWDSFYDLHDRYQDLFGSKAAPRYRSQTPHKSARILPFETPTAS